MFRVVPSDAQVYFTFHLVTVNLFFYCECDVEPQFWALGGSSH